jgi:hypothetical protein
LAWLERQSLTSAETSTRLAWATSASALEIADPMEDDGAVGVGVNEARIEFDRQIKIDEGKGQISTAISLAALLSVKSGVPHLGI